MEKLKGQWPEYMIIPSPREFVHGYWIEPEDGEGLRIVLNEGEEKFLEKNPQVRYECGAKCCLVGFAALAFGEKSVAPRGIRNPATGQFLEKFMEFGGHAGFSDNLYETCNAASVFFEHGDGGTRGYHEMTGKEAHDLWVKTSRYFGYDV